MNIAGKTVITLLFLFGLLALHAQKYVDYLQLSRSDLTNEKYTQAIEHLNIYVKSQAYMYEGYFYRAYAKSQLGDYTGAGHDYDHAISLYPFRADIYCFRANNRGQLSDFSGALDDYDKAMSIDSNDADIYVNRANTYLFLYRFHACIADCNKAEALNFKDDNLYVIRASAEASLKDYKPAISDFAKALKKNPDNLNAMIQRGVAFYAEGQKDSALANYNHVLGKDSNNAYALFQKAMVEIDDSDYVQAMINLNRVLELSPECAVALFNRAILYSDQNRPREALNDYNAILTIDPTSILTYFNRAGLKFSERDLKGALKDYNKAIELYPDFAKAYNYRAEVKKDMSNFKGAGADAAKALEIEKEKAMLTDSTRYMEEIRLLKMTALPEDFGNAGDSKNQIQNKWVDIEPRSLYTVVLSLDTGELIRVYQGKPGKNNSAPVVLLTSKPGAIDERAVFSKIRYLDSLITINPNDASNYLKRAILYSSVQAYQQAFGDYEKTIALNPANGLAYFSRANTRFSYLQILKAFDGDQGRAQLDSIFHHNLPFYTTNELNYKMVMSDFTQCLKYDSNFSYAWYNRATAEFLMRDLKPAVNDLTKALNCDTTLSEGYYDMGLIMIIQKETLTACEYLSKAGELGILESYNVIKRYCYKAKVE